LLKGKGNKKRIERGKPEEFGRGRGLRMAVTGGRLKEKG